jgi:ubiquinone/menaquinone biosynthesis C-methylase UbiE
MLLHALPPHFSFGAVYAAAAKAVRREKMRARHFTNFALSAKLYGIFAERKATGMDSYEALAASYDELTEDVEYEKRADFVEKLFLRAKRPVRSLLDLACGTGTMTVLFARRGYTVTGVDYSPEMLAQAQQKLTALDPPPLLLCQSMPQLKLLEKVDAAICCLDSINYLTRPRDVQRTFNRLHDAIAPGGSLVFDIHAVSKMEKLDGEVLLDEREDVFCLWRTRYRKNVKMLDYEVDLFRLQPDGAWERDFEEHHQRAYTVEELTAWLEEAGFTAIRTHGELKLRRANERDGRIYFSCIRK